MLNKAATAALAAGIGLSGLAGLATPASAVTILNFAQNHATPPGFVLMHDNGDGTTTLATSVGVTITDLAGPLVPPPITNATFTLSALSDGASVLSTFGPITTLNQAYSGTFSITAPGCTVSCLAGTFTDAVISGIVGGNALALIGANTASSALTFTSGTIPASFFGSDFAMSLAKTDLTIPVTQDCSSPVGCTLGSTTSVVAGNFSAVPSTIPEPKTWLMMVMGFAGLGFVGFRSKTKQALID